MTAVVLHELTVGAEDSTKLKYWGAIRKDFEKDQKLLVPNGEDWFLAGKVINSLQRGRKAKNKSKTPKISAEESRRIMRDVLIARTALRENALLVTDNVADFNKISAFCKVRTVTGKEFFGA
ncbi:MAG: type II toxin-antitoxin system VapC family toxin [Pyrinomonadaceae bacterium]